MKNAEQLKLPLFADEYVEPEISICTDIKFKGFNRPHHHVSIERTGTSTFIQIAGLNFLGRQDGTLFRFLSGPGIFDLPFDVILPDLHRLPQEQLISFSVSVIRRHYNNEFAWDARHRYRKYTSPKNE